MLIFSFPVVLLSLELFALVVSSYSMLGIIDIGLQRYASVRKIVKKGVRLIALS